MKSSNYYITENNRQYRTTNKERQGPTTPRYKEKHENMPEDVSVGQDKWS